VDIVLVTAGVACLIAAVAGVAIKAMNIEIGQIVSLRRQFLLGLLGVVFLGAGIIVREGSGTSQPTAQPVTTTAPEPPFFEDNFSIPGTRRWVDDVDTEGTGGQYTDETYHIVAEREMGHRGVLVSAQTAPREDVDLTVDAHPFGGTARSSYGYGLFCRADGWDTLYHFTIWAQHSVIAKSIDGQRTNLGTTSQVTAATLNDADKRLEAVCRTIQRGRAVRLEFWVDDKMILAATDKDSPLTSSGTFGMHVALLPGGGNIGDRLEVEFDNFKAFMAK
jgi:hypothetical protein